MKSNLSTFNGWMKSIAVAALVMSSFEIYADTFDPATGRVLVEGVAVGDTFYQNVLISVAQVHSIGSSTALRQTSAVTTVPTNTCTSANLNEANFLGIQQGMSFLQVLSILNCKPNNGYTAGSYFTKSIDSAGRRSTAVAWQTLTSGDIRVINVTFDASSTAVTADTLGGFKYGAGF